MSAQFRPGSCRWDNVNKVLVAALVALAALSGCGGSHTSTTVASAGNGPEATLTTSAADTVTTAGAPSLGTSATALAPPASTDTTAPPPKESSTTTTARPATTTTRPAATTTTRPAARTVTLTSAPGPYATTVTLQGDGCAGPGYGVTLTMRDPSGQEMSGDGGATQPDGTWQLHEPFNHSQPPGDYTLAASCITTTSAVVFAYGPSIFRWNG
ncbi:MAG: hypothetical protein QOD57_410 [Actinomycetota bacterium]|nr:hypothetical protein [Actinomycetota bacterium]